MPKWIFIVVLFCSLACFSQNRALDSLFHVLKTAEEDTNKVNTLLWIGLELESTGDYAAETDYSEKALKLSRALNYPDGIAQALSHLGNVAQLHGNYEAALKEYFDALKIYENNHDNRGIASTYNNIGVVYHSRGDYSDALKNYMFALDIQTKRGSKRNIANLLNNIAAIYQKLGNYPEALKKHLAALELRIKIGDKHNLSSSYNNVGSVYYLLKMDSLALSYYIVSLKLAIEIGDRHTASLTYNNLGDIHANLNEYDKALKSYSEALKINEALKDQEGIAVNHGNMGYICYLQNNYKEAMQHYLISIKISNTINSRYQLPAYYNCVASLFIKQKNKKGAEAYLDSALTISLENADKKETMESYKLFSGLDSLQGNYKQALQHYKSYIVYRDSLTNEENVKKIVRVQMQYEFDKKEAEVKESQARKDALTAEQIRIKSLELGRSRLIVIILCIILIVVFGFAWLIIRQNKLVAGQKSLVLEQKLLRVQMNPHFIFNSLTAIESFIYDNQPKEAGQYLSDFSRLMRMILENSREESITLDQEINVLSAYLRLQQLNLEDSFSYTIHIDESLNTETIKMPPMLFQPFVENAVKHGFSDAAQSHVSVSFSRHQNNLIVVIADNGRGIGAEQENRTHQSLATSITKERLAIFNRNSVKIHFDIADNVPAGTKVTFTLPAD